jgi:hypothetical protein
MKSQIKLFESIMVLVVFVFLIAIGLRFYTTTQANSLKNIAAEISTLDSLKTTIVLANMPDIACTFEGDSDLSCIDLYKVRAWATLMEEGTSFVDKYISLVGLSDIIVERLYPDPYNWTIYNSSFQNSGYTILGSTYISVPTTIFDPVNRKNQLGIIHVRTYVVQT